MFLTFFEALKALNWEVIDSLNGDAFLTCGSSALIVTDFTDLVSLIEGLNVFAFLSDSM